MASLGRDGDLKVAEHMGGLARALITTSALPLLLLDGDRRVVSASRSFCSAFDILTDGVDGLRVDELGGGGWNIPELNGLLEATIAGQGDAGPFETDLLRPDYPPRRLVMHVQKVDYDGGADVRVLMAIDDVTATRSADSQIATLMIEKDGLLRERAVLLQEMQHRIANSLQIIAGILLMKARNVSSEESRRHLQDAHDRVMSVAAVQEHLQTSVGDVEMCPYLEKLAESLAASMIREARGLALVVRCDPLAVSSQEAVSIGLIVTELVINALKHAFPGERMGQVSIDYALTPLGWTLSVSDDGVGRPDPSTIRSGLGTSVIEALAQQLGAKVVADDTPPGARISVVNTDAGGAAA